MLFRPSFCAHCGERIERDNWGIFTSRRFCQVCESEFKGQDLIPRVIVGLGVIAGVFGLGAYMKTDSSHQTLVARAALSSADAGRLSNAQTPKVANDNRPVVQNIDRKVLEQPQMANIAPNRAPQTVTSVNVEQLYYCGARTKKGSPCSRKVKGNVRCFQHTGMPAMLPADQLKVR